MLCHAEPAKHRGGMHALQVFSANPISCLGAGTQSASALAYTATRPRPQGSSASGRPGPGALAVPARVLPEYRAMPPRAPATASSPPGSQACGPSACPSPVCGSAVATWQIWLPTCGHCAR